MRDGSNGFSGFEAYNRSRARGFSPEPPPPPSPLDIVDPLSLLGVPVPKRRWIVENWIPWHTVSGLYGHGGVGKTLLAQQLQTATATGRPWLGLDVAAVRSLGVYCEDPKDELHIRQNFINQSMGVGFGDLENMKWISRAGKTI